MKLRCASLLCCETSITIKAILNLKYAFFIASAQRFALTLFNRCTSDSTSIEAKIYDGYDNIRWVLKIGFSYFDSKKS